MTATATLLSGAPRLNHLSVSATDTNVEAAWRVALSSCSTAADAMAVASATTGNFAVGINLSNGATFLAVDRFAVETLCYRRVGSELKFAARADQLADGADIDPQAIYDYLYFHAIPSPRTIFKDVFRLPAGHFAWFENGKLSINPYWAPDFSEITRKSFDELRDEFRQTLQDAVASQLDGTKPACFLSGGTDSSTIAGMSAKVCNDRGGPAPASYSIGFEAEGYDEMEYARLAARHFKTDHHEYYVTPADLVASIAKVAGHYDQPFGNSSALPSYYCAKMAHDDGVSKILAGDGGDELFGGNTRYAKQKVFGLYDTIPAPVRTSMLEPLMVQTLAEKTPGLRKAASYVNQAKVPMPDRLQTYNLLERLGAATILTPAFLQQVDTLDPQRQQRAVWATATTEKLVDRMLAFDWRYTLAETDLPKVKGTTALAGLAVGFPMLDDRLLGIALKLPTSYKLKGFKLRWFFKEALRGFLPDEILTKKKQGFGLPFGVWANRDAALKRLATSSVQGLVDRGLVNEEFSNKLLNEHLPAHPGYYGEMIWILMMLEQWLQKHAPDYKVLC